jgi:hypothetical protein
MVLKENLKPPVPSDMMEEISTTTPDGDGQISTIKGLQMSAGKICTDEEW